MAETLERQETNLGSRHATLISEFIGWDDSRLYHGPNLLDVYTGNERIQTHRGNVLVGLDPNSLQRIIIGDAREALYLPSLVGFGVSMDAPTAHRLFEGLKPDEGGNAGRFSYESLQLAAALDELATTADSIYEISDGDVVIYAGYENLVVIGTGNQGPVLALTADQWQEFGDAVYDPDERLNSLVRWADEESETLTRSRT